MQNIARSKIWRDSASLIILSKPNQGALAGCLANSNFEVLLQSRPSIGTFKGASVFPGGVTEPADADPKWLNLFKSFGFKQHHFDGFHRVGAPVTPIFQKNPLRHISLRITAIRETFEELGILICSRKHIDNNSDLYVNIISDIDHKYWRNQVSVNPEKLLTLCKEYNCYPNIWGLHYWSNWLTPATFRKRFDTAFFITALEHKPNSIKGNSEVANTQWLSPAKVLKKSLNQEVTLAPPQAYELTRLDQLTDLHQVIDFARQRQCVGDELYFPVVICAKDGEVRVLPSDSLYPANVNYEEGIITLHKDKTVVEINQSSADRLHRSISKSGLNYFIIKNIKQNNHINMGDRTIQFQM